MFNFFISILFLFLFRYSLLCVNYVLFCCEKSSDLLEICLDYIADILDVDLIDKALQTLDKAFEKVDQSSIDVLNQQTVSLLMKNGQSSLKIFQFLLEIHCKTVSKRLSKRFHVSIHNFLHYWLLDLQRAAQTRYFSYKLSLEEQLFMNEIVRNFEVLSDMYWFMLIHEQTFFVRFYLRALCLAEGDVFAAKLLLHLMLHKFYRSNKFLEILAIIKEVRLSLPNVQAIMVRQLSLLLPKESQNALIYFKSFVYLFCLHTEEAENYQKQFSKAVAENYQSIAKFIAYPNLAISRTVLQFLSLVEIDSTNVFDQLTSLYKLNSYIIALVINICRMGDTAKREVTEKMLKHYLQCLCDKLSAELLAGLRNLLINSLFDLTVSKAHRHIFGGEYYTFSS